MIAAPSPRKDREPHVSRGKFGWGWLALCLACLVLLVVLVVRDGPVKRVNAAAPARVAKERKHTRMRVPDSTMPSNVHADAEAEPVTDEPPIGTKQLSMPADLKNASTIPSARSFEKERNVSNSLAIGSANWIWISDIQPTFVKSPVYLLTNGPGKAFSPRTWLRVVVTFNSNVARVGELTFRYKITIGDQTFGGALTHADILGMGKHQAAVFVIPAALEPLIQRRDFDANTSVGIDVAVLSGEREIARSSFRRGAAVRRREQLGFLRSVEATPFAPLEIDLYELTPERGR